MSAPRLDFPALLALLVLASAAPPCAARPPQERAESALLFAGPDIPAPPWQKRSWAAPQTAVPAKFVAAVAVLFEQGFADPRGCEYREVRVAVGKYWSADSDVVLTHVWVLPGRPEDGPRFVVCWNGLVYPAVSVRGRADLRADVAAAVKAARGDESSERFEPPSDEEAESLWHRSLGADRCVALLLRAGEQELAERLWGVRRAPQTADGEADPYLTLAGEWVSRLYDRGQCAHTRGDDRLALHDFRLLDAAAPQIEAEASKRRSDLDKRLGGERFLDFLDQLPDLLTDQRRRARAAPRPPVVCLGPGREPDQVRRIAALIDRLDEVSGCLFGEGYVSPNPIVAALVREGQPAIEPLLRCYETDTRLTRTIYSARPLVSRGRTLAVHELAYQALAALLEDYDFEPRATEDNPSRDGMAARKDRARQVREYFKAPRKKEPPAERQFRTLADDNADPREWALAAEWLVEPDRRNLPTGEKPLLSGESLRAKKGPSVTELIRKRVGASREARVGADLALALHLWDEKAALPLMADLTPRCREAGEWYRYRDLIAARLAAGDRKGLDDYVKWVRTAKPDTVEHFQELEVFRLMWENPTHPGMAAAAESLFADKSSPWVPRLHNVGTEERFARGSTRLLISSLLTSRLLTFPGFRKTVLAELANKGGRGTVQATRDGVLYQDLEGVASWSFGGRRGDPEIPKEGIHGTFRVCDFIAFQIGEDIPGAPRCETYWPEKRRDAAVAACAEFLKHYGDHTGSRWEGMRLPRLDKPATREQARKGEAIFSLEGEGEVRTVKLTAFPAPARWVTLKELPYEERSPDPDTGKVMITLAYQQDGQVYQAEEVFKEGKWRRYYGFVGSHRVARVPAEEIEFPPPEEGRRSSTWVRLADGIDGRLLLARPQREDDEEWVPRWPSGAAPSFVLDLWNRSGTDRPLPDLKGVRPRLYYSRETVSRRGELVPTASRLADWAELEPRPSVALNVDAGRLLAPAEKVSAYTFDLRDWFEVARPGFYRLVLPSDKGDERAREIRFSVAPP
jgi:hypothetical protein